MTSDFPIRIGVQLQPQHAPHYRDIRDAVRRCEDIGVDIAFNWDHFFPLYGDPDGPHFECWTMLGGLGRADLTHRDRRAGDMQLVPKPRAAGRHGPHRRPHFGRPADPGDRIGMETKRTTTSTATNSALRAAASTIWRPRSPGSRHGWKSSTRTHPRHPDTDRRQGSAQDAAAGGRVRRHLARLHHGRELSGGSRRARRALRRRRPRPGHHRTVSRRGEQQRCSSRRGRRGTDRQRRRPDRAWA